MESNSNIKKNLIYNIAYQILILILPIITVPYVSRVLGANGVGIYSYTYSIVSYFMLFGMLGINNYGNRTIAKCRENKEELSKAFISIHIVQIIMTVFMMIIYTIFIVCIHEYKTVFIIQFIHLISVAFDINWFFFGIEKFKLTVTRNTIIKIISLALILLLVRNENDLWKYTLIMAMSSLLGQIALIPFLKEQVSYQRVKFSDVKKHLKPCLVLFIPVIAVSLYKIMDKTMIGLFTNVKEVGYYEQAEKIINIPMGLITALGTVMLPRISSLVSIGDKKTVESYIKKSVKFTMFFAFPICLGLITISHDFVPIFLGDDFAKTAVLLNLLSCTIIFISFASIIRTQYLIPNERDKEYIVSVFLGAIVNFFANIILIPKYASVGACYGTILAECIVMVYQTYAISRELKIREYIIEIIPFLVKAIIMFVAIQLIGLINIDRLTIIAIQVIVGVIVYGLLNIKYINSIIDIKKLLLRK